MLVKSIVIKGEAFYKSDLIMTKSVCKKGKSIKQIISDEAVNLDAKVNPTKVGDVDKSLKKHYGLKWREFAEMAFYRRVLDDDEENIPMIENCIRN